MLKPVKLIIIVLLLGMMACKKDFHGIPNVRVDIHASLNHPDLMGLSTSTGSVMIAGGIAGIIIYNTGTGYQAYDRCSTVNPEEGCAVILDPDGGPSIVLDPCSGGKFDLRSGSPVKGPAKWPLKQYQVFVANGMLNVYN